MKKNIWNKKIIITLIIFILLIASILAFYFLGCSTNNLILMLSWIGISTLVLIIGIIYLVLVYRGKIKQTKPDYKTFFILSLLFIAGLITWYLTS
ncbi:hypothetical protein CL633_03115 [bacterium]|nr:hypothetical protein [bacterium]